MPETKTGVALVDDHVLLRNGLASLIHSFDNYNVVFEANNGKDFLEMFRTWPSPEIVLLDINMPVMDGFETAFWLKQNHPEIKILALSMYDNEQSIIRMLKCGVKGYVLKDIDPSELKRALDSLVARGYYYSELVTSKLVHVVNELTGPDQNIQNLISLNKREIEFLKFACTELTYKEIADRMMLSARTIDGYRDDLFEKLNVKTRIGLAVYAFKNGIANL